MQEIKQKIQQFNLDVIGASLSILCGVHCVVFPFLMMLQPVLKDSFFFSEFIDQGIVVVSLVIAISSFGMGYSAHRNKLPLILFFISFTLISASHFAGLIDEIIFMPIAGFTLAYSHIVNHKMLHKEQEH